MRQVILSVLLSFTQLLAKGGNVTKVINLSAFNEGIGNRKVVFIAKELSTGTRWVSQQIRMMDGG